MLLSYLLQCRSISNCCSSVTKTKPKKIEALKQNAEIEAKRNKDDIKRAKFESTQQTRARQVSDNSAIDTLDKNRGKIDDKDGFTTITR